ncbi:hypothetical protein IQ07DRAFT_582945 [Pyrenochaeta sp. DS3sAY3a]|nr:hypothetical protein IQ07DRAFT_582945 [Pyrenochaeta sp. DS3sAY3a]
MSMSPQHRNLAAVWEHLLERDDISTTLCEITGQNSLQNLLLDQEQRSREALQTIIWIKTIFDLQRCYLSGTIAGVSECSPNLSPCLLPQELILSSILYLIDIKTRTFLPEGQRIDGKFADSRLILAETVLSGLRLLLLRNQNLLERHRRRLEIAIENAWKDDRSEGVECLVAQQIFPLILRSLRDSDFSDQYQKERLSAQLPKYSIGLYPLNIRAEAFVPPLIHAIAEEDEDWLDAYWVLFDTLWAVECALTQRYVDLHRQDERSSPSQLNHDDDEILDRLYQKRTSLILSVFHITGPMIPSTTLLESLTTNLLDWSEDLDTFLSRQDSLVQHRISLRPSPTRRPSYGKHIAKSQPYIEIALGNFRDWLSKKGPMRGFANCKRSHEAETVTAESLKTWVLKMAAPNSKTLSQAIEEPFPPLYIVDCPSLHVIQKRWLANQLRWRDKIAYERIQGTCSMVEWKESFQCPSCSTGERIKHARLLEPLQGRLIVSHDLSQGRNESSQEINDDSVSYGTTSSSGGSHLVSDSGSGGASMHSQQTMTVTIPSQVSHSGSDLNLSSSVDAKLPRYFESPISPFTQTPSSQRIMSFGHGMSEYPISPLNESLNIPIPLAVGSRLSVDLPIPVHEFSPHNNTSEKISVFTPLEGEIARPEPPLRAVTWSESSLLKPKPASRTIRIANSMRRKPSTKATESHALPKEPSIVFSSRGHSILLWGKHGNFLVRFDIASNDSTSIQCCRYEANSIEAAAAGHRKCALVAAGTASSKRLLIYTGLNITPEADIELEFSGRVSDVCIAISKDDKHLALSTNGQIELFSLENGLKRVAFHQQMNVYELRGGVSHRRSIPITRMTSDDSTTSDSKGESGSWFTEQSRSLSSKEVAEEQQRQTVIIARKLYFSTDSERLVVATQLGDHCVYIDVWDITREPVGTIAEHSRSFKLPPWTLNDGDLTGVFYDSERRAALVTAFLGKEYPVLVPFPGYEALQNETYSTKIVAATQSPSGSSFIVTNGMTEIIQFQYTAKGTLAPHKLKKSSSKMSTSIFKPGAVALAMPAEDCLRVFWIKDGKCMLRSIKLGASETVKDVDIRSYYNKLMSLKDRPVIAQSPMLDIPELDSGDYN